MPGWPTTSAAGTRTRSSRKRPTSSSRRSRSGWGSIAPTSASSCTPARRSRSSTISRNPAAPAATASKPSACSVYSTADFMKWRLMLERNGELTEAARKLLRDMERYAASVGCRHRHLVGYFGETYARADCSACDYCLDELETADDSVQLARKVLSCVARVGQRFGVAHVANVLCGKDSDQVTSRRHHELTTFGLLRDASVPEVRGYIEQLLAHGFLRQTDDAFPVVGLTAGGHRAAEESRQPARARARPSAAAGEGAAAEAVADRGGVVAGRGSRSVRAASRRAPGDRARARRAAVRDLPRHDAARDGAAAPEDAWASCTASAASARGRPRISARFS